MRACVCVSVSAWTGACACVYLSMRVCDKSCVRVCGGCVCVTVSALGGACVCVRGFVCVTVRV